MPEVLHQERRIEYDLNLKVYKRGLTLRIKENGAVVVTASKTAAGDYVHQFVLKHADWIVRHQERVRRLINAHPLKEFINGEFFSVFGKEYQLQIIPTLERVTSSCEIIEDRLRVVVRDGIHGSIKEAVREALIQFYGRQTFEKAGQCVEQYAGLLGVLPKKIRIGNQKSRWGSCSGKGSLRFNWRLSLAPPSILEYVVVHELCHLQQPNHSKNFWRMVQMALPDYRAHRQWLRGNSFKLMRAVL